MHPVLQYVYSVTTEKMLCLYFILIVSFNANIYENAEFYIYIES